MDESGLVGDVQSLRTTPTIDLEPYQWVFFVLVVSCFVCAERLPRPAFQAKGKQVNTGITGCLAWQMGYIPLTAIQLRYTGSYPAERHRTDAWSKALVGFHILAGSMVIYGGMCSLTLSCSCSSVRRNVCPLSPAVQLTFASVVF